MYYYFRDLKKITVGEMTRPRVDHSMRRLTASWFVQ